jgi:hypothetical protein
MQGGRSIARTGGGLLGACLLAGVLLGCEEDVTAVLGAEQAYSMYGVLTPQLDTQWVRVFPVEDLLEPAAPEPLDAVFTSVDLTSGAEHVWRDSIVLGADGQYGHVFWAPFTADYEHRYQLRVASSAGEESRVEVTMPSFAELEVQEPLTSGGVFQPILLKGDVPNLLRLEVVYQIKFGFGPGTEIDAALPYDGRQQRVPEGWVITVALTEDYATIRQALQAALLWDPSFQVVLLGLTFRLIVGNEAWDPPGGVFDPNVLVEPGTMNNVENGFGFVGAGYRLEVLWLPDDEVLERAGFRILPSEE